MVTRMRIENNTKYNKVDIIADLEKKVISIEK